MADDLESLVLTISADTRQIQRALKRLEGDTGASLDRVAKAFDRPGDGIERLSKKMGQTRFETANLAAQFQDIAVQLQSGQSPFTIALQQGTQISSVLGQRGAAGVVGMLGSAFGSLINPVSLATIAIIALGGAAVQYASRAFGGVKDVDEALKTHAELIKSLKGAYGEAGKAVDDYAQESRAVLEARILLSIRELEKQFKSLSGSILDTATRSRDFVEHMRTVAQNAGVAIPPEALQRFNQITAAVERFSASAESGQPDVRGFRDELARLLLENRNDEQLAKIIKRLLEMTDEAEKVQRAINATGRSLRALGDVASGEAAKLGEYNKALKELAGIALPDLDDRAKALKAFQEAIAQSGGLEERIAAERQYADALKRIRDKEQKEADEAAKKDAERLAKRGARRQDAFNRDLADIQHRTDALLLEVEMIGRTEQERDKAAAVLKLENEARRAGIMLTDEQRVKIDQLATAYAAAAEQSRRANEVMADIRQAGNAASDAFKQLVIEGKNFNEVLSNLLQRLASLAIDKAFNSLFSSIGGSFVSSIFGGGGGFASGLAALNSGSAISIGRAGGGPVRAGDIRPVGERGPELFIPDVNGRIIPNHKLRAMAANDAPSITFAPVIDARGADVAAVARLETAMARQQAEFEARVIRTVREGRGRRLI